jgi:hypothetical protein
MNISIIGLYNEIKFDRLYASTNFYSFVSLVCVDYAMWLMRSSFA